MSTDNNELPTPPYGITQIDGQAATSIRYDLKSKDDQEAYNISFMMGKSSVARIKNIPAQELNNIVGEKNAQSIIESDKPKGSLSGQSLSHEYGYSPNVEQQEELFSNIVEHDIERENEIIIDDKTKEELAKAREKDSKQYLKEKGITEEKEEINIDAAKAHLARVRNAQRQQYLNELKKKGVELDDNKDVNQDNALQQSQAKDQTSAPTTDIAPEKRRQELEDQVQNQFRVAGNRFYFKEQPNRIAFTDKGEKMVSSSNDQRAAKAMATMAEAKNWSNLKVSGHPEFRREVWLEASLRGIKVRGYEPKEKDLRDLDTQLQRLSKNTVEKVTEKTANINKNIDSVLKKVDPIEQAKQEANAQDRLKGEQQESNNQKVTPLRSYQGNLIEHGKAHYKNDPQENLSYYVKLDTEKGEQIVWGVDLQRAISDSGAVKGDNINLEYKGKTPVTIEVAERDKEGNITGVKEVDTIRNTWGVEKTDKQKVIEAVASEIISQKVKDPQQQAVYMQAINQRLNEREQAGTTPTVKVYDKSAEKQTPQHERQKSNRTKDRTVAEQLQDTSWAK